MEPSPADGRNEPHPSSSSPHLQWCITQPREHYFRGVSFSPDGLCVLTATADPTLQVWNLLPTQQPLRPAVTSRCGDSLRSYAWYPAMDSSQPATCCFAAAARAQPIHLFDAYTGAVRASYAPYNGLDELEAPNVIALTESLLYAAGMRTDRVVHVMDLAVPGCRASTVLRLGKTRRSSDGQKGLVSALATSTSDPSLLVVGTYSPGSLYLYDVRAGQVESGTILDGTCIVGHGRKKNKQRNEASSSDNDRDWITAAKDSWFRSKTGGGVTQLHLEADTYQVYSASRRSNAILQWDLRMLRGVASFATHNEDTNQTLEFDILLEDNCLLAGSTQNEVLRYDLTTQKLKGSIIDALDGVANGVSAHDAKGQTWVAVACGARQFPSPEDMDNDLLPTVSSSLRLYQYTMAS